MESQMPEKIDSEFNPNEGGEGKLNPHFITLLSDFVVNRDADTFLQGIEGSKEIEASLVDFEQIKGMVKHLGTMTHITELASVESWAKLRIGEQAEFNFRHDETAASFNVTDLDGKNYSVESPKDDDIWTLKAQKGFKDNCLIIFSQNASEKIAGRAVFEPLFFQR